MKHSPELGFDDDGRPVLITAAAPSFEEEHRARVRKYLIMMSCRIPAFVLAALAYAQWHNGLLSMAILAVSIPLPWMAVLIANDRPPRRAGEPRRYDAASPHPSLRHAAHDRMLETGPAVPHTADGPGPTPR
ncbi:DUF3099 domain-containing protein [Mycolicibacillus parakoreensis]|uniref:DUF3099 domain-containing protein n=2 Tax=Mycobacteriaceae TaxID=1762 RepID=A0ABY3TVA2_9MYCO|nr:DUF3099 domain-containing protein [Mycolicibacillus parakoreensis]MCV7317213.1 DUF3099 domain-containing protein [Mycolicibacillus parakoreensis]ULN51575.1 DUF3099 domain-containing protein [Mycolicibacillus parakoreensis]